MNNVTSTYVDADHPSFGATLIPSGEIWINVERLGESSEDLTTMLHEGYHSMYSGTPHPDSDAEIFANTCM